MQKESLSLLSFSVLVDEMGRIILASETHCTNQGDNGLVKTGYFNGSTVAFGDT